MVVERSSGIAVKTYYIKGVKYERDEWLKKRLDILGGGAMRDLL